MGLTLNLTNSSSRFLLFFYIAPARIFLSANINLNSTVGVCTKDQLGVKLLNRPTMINGFITEAIVSPVNKTI